MAALLVVLCRLGLKGLQRRDLIVEYVSTAKAFANIDREHDTFTFENRKMRQCTVAEMDTQSR